jgi:DNA-binding transcriptional LysR family regulator
MKEANLNDMALFVEVVKARGFRSAATAVGIPDSTLSRRIGRLEKSIGLRLLHRTTRKIELTEAGQIYYERCRRIVDEARLAHQQLGEMLEHPSGMLRISLPVDFAVAFVAPRMAEFAARFPGISFEFDLSPRRVDLVSEPFDVAIRMGSQPDSTLVARKLAEFSGYVYASPAYLAVHGEPRVPQDLVAHECLLFGASQTSWRLMRGDESIEVKVGGRYRFNSIGMIQRMAGLGTGVALLAELLAGDDLAAGRLRRILPAWQATPVSVYAVTETRLIPAKTQRFIEFLKVCLSQI